MSDSEDEREKNIKELQDFLTESLQDAELQEAIGFLKSKPVERTNVKKPRRKNTDETFTFSGYIPLEKRKSARLQNQAPQFSYTDLPDEDHRARSPTSDVEDLEEVIYIKRKKSFKSRPSLPAPNKPVEEITSSYLDKVAYNSTKKIYSQDGTSCHQCRQKTLDSKTYCRSGRCIGVRGQFCGPCLRNRYGEEVTVVLLDPNWECPPCRNLCNCSICRTREGKRPTGILAPIAQRRGHTSVKDFLLHLQEKGEYGERGDFRKDYSSDKDSSEKEDYYEEGNSMDEEDDYKKRRNFKVRFSGFWKQQPRKLKKKRKLSDSDSDGELEYLLGFDEHFLPVVEKPVKKSIKIKTDSVITDGLLGFDENLLPVMETNEE